MTSVLRLLLTLPILSPLLRPLTRLIVGAIAIPLFRLFLRRVVRLDELDRELSKDLEQWFRGSLLLLVATANMEDNLFGWVPLDLNGEYAWLAVGMRILLAVGVIEAMPDVDLFAIIHPGPSRLLWRQARGTRSFPKQAWMLVKSLLCRHLDRSSAVFAILAAIFTGPVGWICYSIAIVQFLIIGLVTSRDKALDVLSAFDREVELRRRDLMRASGSEPAASAEERRPEFERQDFERQALEQPAIERIDPGRDRPLRPEPAVAASFSAAGGSPRMAD